MSGLRKLQCDNCAGKIDGITLTCQSCGMQYMLKDDMTLGRVITSNLQWASIGCMITIPSYVLFDVSKERAAEMTLQQITETLSTKLLPFMELQSSFDPIHNEIATFGRIRVAEPLVNRYGRVQMKMPDIASDIFRWEEK